MSRRNKWPPSWPSCPWARSPASASGGQATLASLGIRVVGDVLAYPPEFFERQLGKWGLELVERAHGRGSAVVSPEREAKSTSAENTFAADTADRETLAAWLLLQAERVGRELRRDGLRGRTVTLKLKFGDFRQITRSRTLAEATDSDTVIFETAVSLLAAEPLPRPVRLIGVGVSHFGNEMRQLSLFETPDKLSRQRAGRIDAALDTIRSRFGREAIIRGRLFGFKKNS